MPLAVDGLEYGSDLASENKNASPSLTIKTRLLRYQIKYNYMEQGMELNRAQMSILRLLSRMKTVEQVEELRQLISNYYAQKATEEMDKLWDSGEWNEEKNKAVLGEHLRTPYRV